MEDTYRNSGDRVENTYTATYQIRGSKNALGTHRKQQLDAYYEYDPQTERLRILRQREFDDGYG